MGWAIFKLGQETLFRNLGVGEEVEEMRPLRHFLLTLSGEEKK